MRAGRFDGFKNFGQLVQRASTTGASHYFCLVSRYSGCLNDVATYFCCLRRIHCRRFQAYGVLVAIKKQGAEVNCGGYSQILFRVYFGIFQNYYGRGLAYSCYFLANFTYAVAAASSEHGYAGVVFEFVVVDD